MNHNWMPLPRYLLRKNLVIQVLKKHLPESKSCLEIGYGPGDMLIEFSKMGLDTFGFDFSYEAYVETKKRIKRCSSVIRERIKLFTHEKEMGFLRYDFIIALEVLEHVKEDEAMLANINTCLKKKGLLIFSVPAHKSKWGENDLWAGHYRRYEKNEIAEKLVSNKFEPLHIWSYGYPLILLLDLLIHRNRKKDLTSLIGISKEALTKQSGIKRKNNFINRMASWKIWVFPFFLLQKLFLNADLSSAILVIARKKD